MIPGVCPTCGGVRPITEYLGEARERQALEAALRLDPRLADPLLEYLALFAPVGRKLASNKLVRLLTELHQLISAGTVSRGRVEYPAPVEYWRAGLEEMVARRDRLTLPLKSHGYLQEVVCGIANKAAAAAERKEEETKSYRHHRESTGGPVAVAQAVDPQARREAGLRGAAAAKAAITGRKPQ